MTVEDVLTRALNAEAEARDIDLPALHRDVLGRLPDRPRRQRWPLVAVAAGGVLVAGTAVTALLMSGNDSTIQGADEWGRRHGVHLPPGERHRLRHDQGRRFPARPVRWAESAEVARLEHAPTFEFIPAGDTATLRLGNADGSLGASRRTRWWAAPGRCAPLGSARAQATFRSLLSEPRCSWVSTGRSPGRPSASTSAAACRRASWTTGRTTTWPGHRGPSEHVRRARRRGGWCWVSGEPDAYLLPDRIPPSATSGQPHDVSSLLVNPDMMVGRENPYGVWAYDVDGPGDFSAVLSDGTVVPAKEVTQPEWGGRRVLVVLALRAQVVTLQFTDAGGEVTTWEPGRAG